MWPVSYHLDLAKHVMDAKITPSDCIALPKDFNIGIEMGAVWLYSEAVPYTGGMIGVRFKTDPPAIVRGWRFGIYGFAHIIEHPKSQLPDERTCDLPGIYFRRFLCRDSPPWTTLRVSLWYPILLSSALPILWIFRHGRKAFMI
jgi:hypothetical protein